MAAPRVVARAETMSTKTSFVVRSISFVAACGLLTACPEDKNKAEKAGEKIEKAGEKAGGKLEKAGDKIEAEIDENN